MDCKSVIVDRGQVPLSPEKKFDEFEVGRVIVKEGMLVVRHAARWCELFWTTRNASLGTKQDGK